MGPRPIQRAVHRLRAVLIISFLAVVALPLMLPLGVAAEATSASFELTRQTIDGGGTPAASDSFQIVSGTIGQPEAGRPMTSSSFTLSGGFQRAASIAGPRSEDLFADGFEGGVPRRS